MSQKAVAAAMLLLITANIVLIRNMLAEVKPANHDHREVAEMAERFVPGSITRSKRVVAVAIINPHERRLLRRFFDDIDESQLAGAIHTISIATEPLPMNQGNVGREHIVAAAPTISSALREMNGLNGSRWIVYDSGKVVESGLIRAGGMVAVIERIRNPRSSAAEAIASKMTSLYSSGQLPGVRIGRTRFVLIASQINSSCAAARIIRDIEERRDVLGDTVQVVVTDDWSRDQITALQQTMGTSLVIERLSGSATTTWKQLERAYGAGLGSGTLVALDKDGMSVVTGLPKITARLREDM